MSAEDKLRGCHAWRMEDRVLKHHSSFDSWLAAVRANPRPEPVLELLCIAACRNQYSRRRGSKVCIAESRQHNGRFRLNLKVPLMELNASLDLREPLIDVAEKRHHLCGFEDVRHRG